MNVEGIGLFEARQNVMREIADQQRRRGIVWTSEQRQASDAAINLVLSDPSQDGHGGLMKAYERAGAARLAKALNRSVDDLQSHWTATSKSYGR